jgi:hypothetical protein
LDNIDFDSGEIDDNVVQFDDDDLLKKAVKIRRISRMLNRVVFLRIQLNVISWWNFI